MELKICPDCSGEYYAHIDTCVDCGTTLLTFEEHEKRQEKRRQCREKALEDPVAVRGGALKWIDELYNMLIGSDIPCKVYTEEACGKGCSGPTCHLLVSRQDGERASGRIEEYCSEIHPELRIAQELISQGKCPACGTPVDTSAVECPDCGLTLLIVE